MNLIRAIVLGEKNKEVHEAFIKFSKGLFSNKYLLEAKKQKGQWSIKGSAEWANTFVKLALGNAGERIKVEGAIIATFDVAEKAAFPVERVKQFMGIKQAIVNTEIASKELLEFMERYPRAFYALSFFTPSCQLKIKAKAPKSAKPATSGKKEVKPDFCSLKTSDESIIKELFFDNSSFQEISIKHDIIIENIAIPSGIKDPVQVREQAVRKGKIIRILKADGKEDKKEYAFEA